MQTKSIFEQGKPPAQRTIDEEDEELVQAKSNTDRSSSIMNGLSPLNNVLQRGGNSMPVSTRSFFESRFGCDFNKVRLHNGSDSALAAQSINARAFTLRNDIVFGTGQYNTESYQGKKLLAH